MFEFSVIIGGIIGYMLGLTHIITIFACGILIKKLFTSMFTCYMVLSVLGYINVNYLMMKGPFHNNAVSEIVFGIAASMVAVYLIHRISNRGKKVSPSSDSQSVTSNE